jgi:hypothetical protein
VFEGLEAELVGPDGGGNGAGGSGEIPGGGDGVGGGWGEDGPEETEEAGGGEGRGELGGPAFAEVAAEAGDALADPLGGHFFAACDLFEALAVALAEEPFKGLLVGFSAGEVALGPAEQVAAGAFVGGSRLVGGVGEGLAAVTAVEIDDFVADDAAEPAAEVAGLAELYPGR